MYKKIITLIACIAIPLLSLANVNTIYTDSEYQGRKINPLEVGVRTSYPPKVTTVGQAVVYALVASGYKLAVGYPASRTAADIIAMPIPPEAIQDKTMPIYQALLLLIGKNNCLVVDTKHKLITFEKITGRG